MQKVAMFIDGFNFYYAIKHNEDAIPIGLGWCDFRKLAEGHMMNRESEHLHSIKYFTAPVKHFGSPKEQDDQSLWLRAARTIPGIQVIEGFHQQHPDKAREEKQTDVNIAVELLLGALEPDGYDRAILVTGDIDQAPAAIAVQKRLKQPKAVSVWIPPMRNYARWKEVSRKHNIPCKVIKPEMLATSRLLDVIETAAGQIECLDIWKMPS